MRTFTLKGLFVTAVFMVLGCLAIHAADGNLIGCPVPCSRF